MQLTRHGDWDQRFHSWAGARPLFTKNTSIDILHRQTALKSRWNRRRLQLQHDKSYMELRDKNRSSKRTFKKNFKLWQCVIMK